MNLVQIKTELSTQCAPVLKHPANIKDSSIMIFVKLFRTAMSHLHFFLILDNSAD